MLALRKIMAGPGASLQNVDPPVLRASELRLAVEAVGICGTDLHIVDWHGGYEAMETVMPVTLGHEIAARVISGEGLPHGQRVVVRPSVTCEIACKTCGGNREDSCLKRTGIGIFRDGGFAQELLAPLRNCVPIPAGVPSEHAALTEPLTVSHEAARNAAIQPGDRVLVLGPGPIGLGAALFAREFGAEVVVAGRQDRVRLEAARALGFEHALDVGDGSLADALERAGLVGSFQAIIEAVGAPAVLRESMDLLAPHGRTVIAGIHPRPVEIDVTRLVRQHQALVGSYRAPFATWRTVLDWIAVHPSHAKTMISARLPLTRIEEGFRLMRDRAVVKVIIEPGEG
ncbi:MAG: alcohol dehydrogenase catalytic domain-containing protein [Rhizobiales bacterium]|nr:alcohol dehydrogenase catalytic domain-containing protein [Hyphomicrobiales bacterium]